jgi:hypothetical protein
MMSPWTGGDARLGGTSLGQELRTVARVQQPPAEEAHHEPDDGGGSHPATTLATGPAEAILVTGSCSGEGQHARRPVVTFESPQDVGSLLGEAPVIKNRVCFSVQRVHFRHDAEQLGMTSRAGFTLREARVGLCTLNERQQFVVGQVPVSRHHASIWRAVPGAL